MPPRNRTNYPFTQRSLNSSSYARNMTVYSNQVAPSRNRPTHKRGGSGKIKLFLIAVLLAVVGVHLGFSKHASAVVAQVHQQQIQVTAENNRKAADFTQEVNALIAADPQVTFSVATISATNGLQTYGASSTAFDAASEGKLLTAADFLTHVQNGTATLDMTIDGENAESLLETMIVNSDDTAWLDLNEYLGNDDMSAYANTIGFANYDPVNNTFPASDAAMILQKLYAKQLLNPANTSLLLGYLQQANCRTYIVPAVPSTDTVYHKVGLDEDNVHDAAIITNGSQSFELVIFTNGNGTYDWTDRATVMQQITTDAIAAFL